VASVFSKYRYYAISVITLLTKFEQPAKIFSIFAGRSHLTPTVIRIRDNGLQFMVRGAMDIWIIKETCLDRDYLWIEPLNPDWNIVDVGAGLGDFTVYASKLCPQGVIHAYEPLEESFLLLEENISLNQVHNARTFREAATGSHRHLTPVTAEAEAVSTRFIESAGRWEIQSVNLATALDRLPDGKCDFLKIDCEGCEYDLLFNTDQKTLARISRLSLEYHEGFTDYSSEELIKFLEQNNFSVLHRPSPVHSHLGYLYARRREPKTQKTTIET
jgi:FkbM family methyltransferase